MPDVRHRREAAARRDVGVREGDGYAIDPVHSHNAQIGVIHEDEMTTLRVSDDENQRVIVVCLTDDEVKSLIRALRRVIAPP